jgi:hypothetical protein
MGLVGEFERFEYNADFVWVWGAPVAPECEWEYWHDVWRWSAGFVRAFDVDVRSETQSGHWGCRRIGVHLLIHFPDGQTFRQIHF